MEQELFDELQEKVQFVKKLSDAFKVLKYTSIDGINLEVFENKNNSHVEEYLVVSYRGGAKSVRTANINSNTVNFTEIGRMLDSGYYSELEAYDKLTKNPDYTRVL